jgi:hypothetical protein
MAKKTEDVSIYARVKKEEARLKKIFADMDKNKLQTVVKLIKNAAFMSVTLASLEEKIAKDGCVCEYQNGENQFGVKKSPEVEIHLAMSKNYLAAVKQLVDIVPPERKKESRLQTMRDE